MSYSAAAGSSVPRFPGSIGFLRADMFISHHYKLLFLEVPGTGSRSITRALSEMDPDSPTVLERRSGRTGAQDHGFNSEYLDDPAYRVMATHRNPYERLWSLWKHRNRIGNPLTFREISWNRYVDRVCEPAPDQELAEALDGKPIAEMFDLERVDVWLDFSTLRMSWARRVLQLGLPLIPLRFVNASSDRGSDSSSDHGSLANAYTGEMAERIGRRFARDFEFFGYDLDSWMVRPPSAGAADEVASARPRGPEPEAAKPQVTKPQVTKPQVAKPQVAKPRVAILTGFVKQLTAYSLIRVVEDQLAMLTRHGYEPMVLVLASDHWDEPVGEFADERVTIVQYPRVQWNNPEDEEDAFVSDIDTLREALRGPLSRADVVLTHDIIYLPTYLKVAIACRQLAQELSRLRWLHWIHSASPPLKFAKDGMAAALFESVLAQKWPGSYPVFFNRMSIPRIANHFPYEESEVRIVPHPIDVCRFLGLGPLATRLYEEKRLYRADYVSIVPVRLVRGKQVDWVIRILASLKALGDEVRVVVMDFHSNDEKRNRYREELKEIAREWGMDSHELTFLSEFDDSMNYEAPHGLVRELFLLANLFIQPSRSESYSLTTQEAAATGNLLVLNDDFPPFREMYGEDALYFQFSSKIDRIRLQDGETRLQMNHLELPFLPTEYPRNRVCEFEGGWRVSGDAVHAHAIATRIRYEFGSSKVLRQRQKRLRDRNLYSVFRNYFEPLILTVCDS